MSENPQDQPPTTPQSKPFEEWRQSVSRLKADYEERFTEREREAAIRSVDDGLSTSIPTSVNEIFDDLLVSLFTNQRWHVGDLMDYWSTLLPDYADKGEAFLTAWKTAIGVQDLQGTRRFRRFLSGTGLMSQGRFMVFVRRGGATITVYIGTQGKDLFVSLRAFIKTPINWFFVLGLVILSFLLPFIFLTNRFLGFGVILTWQFLSLMGGTFLVLVVLMAITRRQLFFLPPSNIYFDDVSSLEIVVYQTLLSAADEIGIERAQFPPFTPLGAQSPRETWQRRF